MWLQGGYGGCHSVLGDGWVKLVARVVSMVFSWFLWCFAWLSMVLWVVAKVFWVGCHGVLGCG